MSHHTSIRSCRKRRLLGIGAVLFLFMVAGCRGKKPAQAIARFPSDTLTVAFYNIENLFDLHDDGTEYPEYRPGAFGWNKQAWEIKNGNIAAVIVALNADIIGLCEVENRNTLNGLRHELSRRNAPYPYAAIADGPNRTVNCAALLSRLPLQGVHEFAPEFGSCRNILEADIDLGGTVLKVFVNHWPSKFHPESHRMAMAEALSRRVASLPLSIPYLLLGDFNSDYDEWREFRTEGLDDTKGLTGLNNVLNTVQSSGGTTLSFVTKRGMCGGIGLAHYDCWLDLPPDNRFSFIYHGRHETPDHFLLPAALFCGKEISYCDRSFAVFTWGNRLLRNGEPFSWQMAGAGKYKFHKGEGYSDHLPVLIRLVKKPFTGAGPGTDARAAGEDPAVSPPGGFEESAEGWLPGGAGVEVARDSVLPASGRYCLRIKGGPAGKNRCVARTVINRGALNTSRWIRMTFDIRGSGTIQVRARSGRGKWRFFAGQALRYYRSSRYLPLAFPGWKHVVLSCAADDPASRDLTIELWAGRNAPFCVFLDNVNVE